MFCVLSIYVIVSLCNDNYKVILCTANNTLQSFNEFIPVLIQLSLAKALDVIYATHLSLLLKISFVAH